MFSRVTKIVFAILLAGSLVGANFEINIESDAIDRNHGNPVQSYANVLDRATPAVVSVYTAQIVRYSRSLGNSQQEELLRRFFGVPIPHREYQSEPEEKRIPQGVGSGVIINSEGYILTNNHVVSNERGGDADEILVKLSDGRELPARIVGRDPQTDVAVLKVDETGLPIVQVADSDNLLVGDIVFAVGNPMSVGLTVTQGIVSATRRSIGIYGDSGYESFIQTDASINPGNSGGALIDSKGRLIGLNSAIISRSGGNIGIGFAIPSNLAVNIAKQLVQSGEVKRGFIGVSISDLTPEMAEAFDLGDHIGVLINDVEKKSAADVGGLKRGDVVLRLNGKTIDSVNQFRIKVGHTPPGDSLKMDVIRNGKKKTFEVEVRHASGRFSVSANELLEGVHVAEIDQENSSSYRIPESVRGVLVTSVENDSPYARKIIEGMVLIEVNDQEVFDVHQARTALVSGMNKLYVYSRGRTGYIAVRVE